MMFWESVLDDVLLEALFLWLSHGSENVRDVLLEALFLALCSRSQSVDDVLLEALFVGLCYVIGVRLLMMFCWRQFFDGDVGRVSALMMFCWRHCL